MKKMMKGQVLVGAVLIMLVVLLFIPILIQYGQTESKWSTKQQKNTQAFQIAEFGIERGYQQLILSSTTWAQVRAGTVVAGFNFDTTYLDAGGGEYQIRFTTAAGTGVYVTAVGRDKDRRESRGIKAMYMGTADLTNAIYAQAEASVNSSADVQWAPIMSRTSIDAGSRTYPRFFCTGAITLDANGSTPPNTDNLQWWSWQSNLPAMPSIDLQYYKSRAQTLGATPIPANCGATYYMAGNIDIKGCNNAGAAVTGTWYATNDITFQAGSGGNIVDGEVIALGAVNINGNGGATRSLTVSVPPVAWKEYGNPSAWTYFKANFDPGAPATYAAADTAGYTTPGTTTKTINNILVNGLLYTGGNFEATGSGNSNYYGVVICLGDADVGSNVSFYFNPTVSSTFRYTQNLIQRTSWQDVVCHWVGTGSAICP